MSVRSAVIVLIALCGAGAAAAQPAMSLVDQPGFIRAGDYSQVRPGRVPDRGMNVPIRRSASITCGGTRYTVSVAGGSCNTHYNPDSDGNPTPPDYAQCTGPGGARATASCRHGCYPATGSGRCTTS